MTGPQSNNPEPMRPPPTPQPKPVGATPGVGLPSEIGGYRIQRVLGSGGMATVYAALQPQPRRIVALKVMKAAVASDIAFRRFKREIEILGKLHHPYIAQVFDAGTHAAADGTVMPYFVMEYISGGKNILQYVAEKQLDLRERLKLFAKVCAAVEHGHLNKIIHRDIKSSNILITPEGDPKVIDFGVAHATEIEVAGQTMHTEAGRLVGTLQYMSPEQVSGRPEDLDPRCDVYALGVLLYRMLTGRPPHDLEALPVYEAVRIIREETPTAPSAIKPELRGDLETIILKAIDPDRSRRYKNAGSLGRDIVRYLAHKPINARRASLLYRARLFARRQRTPLISAGIVAIVMAIAVGIVGYDRWRLRSELRTNAAAPAALADAAGPINAARTAEQVQEAIANRAAAAAAAAREPFTLAEHTSRVTSLAFSPDARHLASASDDHSVLLWDMQSQSLLMTFRDHDRPVRHTAFSTDGSRLVTCGDDGAIFVLDAREAVASARPALLYDIEHSHGPLHALALNADGTRMAMSAEDLTLRVRPTDQGREIVIRGSTGAFSCAAFSPDGTLLAGGSQRDAIYVWDITADPPPLLHRFDDLRGEIIAVRLTHAPSTGSPSVSAPSDAADDSLWLIAVARDGATMIRSLNIERSDNDAAVIRFNAGPSDRPRREDHEEDGGDGDDDKAGRIELIDACIDFTGRYLACAIETTIAVWDLAPAFAGSEPVRLGRLFKLQEPAYAIAIDPTGTWCAIGLNNGDVRVLPVQRRE